MDDFGDERDLQVLSREELAARVRRRTAELQDVMDTMADVLVTLDPEGRVEMANAAVETVLGYDPEALEGRRLDYLLATGDGDLAESFPGAKLVERLVAEGEIRALEVVFETADGETVPMQLSASVLREGGSVSGYVCVAKDVTERKRRERELQRQNEYLDAFASVVSHDVGKPVATIENKAQLIEMTGDVDHVEGIYEAIERIREMTDELLTLARRGRQVGDTEPVDLASVVRDAWDEVDPADATLTVETDLTVEASPDRLRQLLVNLLSNSVEHGGDGIAVTVGTLEGPPANDGSRTSPRGSPEGGPTDGKRGTSPERSPESGPADGERGASPGRSTGNEPGDSEDESSPVAGFYVADDGLGLPSDLEDLDDVFERGVTTDEGGTGLGLAIVRRIADGHGWSVRATDSETGGARFEVYTGGTGRTAE